MSTIQRSTSLLFSLSRSLNVERSFAAKETAFLTWCIQLISQVGNNRILQFLATTAIEQLAPSPSKTVSPHLSTTTAKNYEKSSYQTQSNIVATTKTDNTRKQLFIEHQSKKSKIRNDKVFGLPKNVGRINMKRLQDD